VGLSGSFGVFFAGHLEARFYDDHGKSLGTMRIMDVSPSDPVSLESEITPPAKPGRVSLHLVDQAGVDRGALQEVLIMSRDSR
jgi:hypothetical protein